MTPGETLGTLYSIVSVLLKQTRPGPGQDQGALHRDSGFCLEMPAQQLCDSFRFRELRGVFYNGLKDKVGLAAAKAAG
jgi:hypothetical protein